ncbi:GNAT family N-acetyltransferase [Bauldia sp.]|uniref:GNAT family N-acetyltransferase n=1 Tax=Bauldia sp. TaxID=2575872 RepID=UPI003BAAE348
MIDLLNAPRTVVAALDAADAHMLADIHGETFPRAWSADEFAALLADTAVFGLGARRQGLFWPARLVGFVLMRLAADEAEVLTIAVRAGRQGRGFGRLLMDEALRQLYRDRIDACFLEVDRDNQAAVHLYQRLGFETVGERKGYYYRPDGPAGAALVMRLKLR